MVSSDRTVCGCQETDILLFPSLLLLVVWCSAIPYIAVVLIGVKSNEPGEITNLVENCAFFVRLFFCCVSELNWLVIEMPFTPARGQIHRETVGKGRGHTQLSPFSIRELGQQVTCLGEPQHSMIRSESRKSRALSMVIGATSICLSSRLGKLWHSKCLSWRKIKKKKQEESFPLLKAWWQLCGWTSYSLSEAGFSLLKTVSWPKAPGWWPRFSFTITTNW